MYVKPLCTKCNCLYSSSMDDLVLVEKSDTIIKDPYNTRIGLKLIDILYHSTPSYYKYN